MAELRRDGAAAAVSAFFEIHRDPDGKITDLTPIPAEQVRIVRDRGGLIGFEVTAPFADDAAREAAQVWCARCAAVRGPRPDRACPVCHLRLTWEPPYTPGGPTPSCGRPECQPYTPGGPTPACGRPECAPYDVEAGLARLHAWMRDEGHVADDGGG